MKNGDAEEHMPLFPRKGVQPDLSPKLLDTDGSPERFFFKCYFFLIIILK